MRNKFSMLGLLWISFCVIGYAQVSDVATGLGAPWGIVIHGDDLYISENSGNKISKLDLTNPAEGTVDVVTGLSGAAGLIFNGNDLIVGERTGNIVSKIDITADELKAKYVTDLFFPPVGFAILNNELYIAARDGNKILKLDLMDSSGSSSTVIENLTFSYDVAIYENELYISEDTRVSKIDLTADVFKLVSVASGLETPIGLTFNGSELYIADFGKGKVFKKDVADPNARLETVVSNLSGPVALAFKGDELYISEFSGNKVSKMFIEVPNAVEAIEKEIVTAYPNPSNDVLHFSSIKGKTGYSIYNIQGEKMKTGILSGNLDMQIADFENGLYLILFENGKTFRFVKE